jgi:hypothetical protein
MRVALLAVLLATGSAYADDRGSPKREGDYGGVNPGQPQIPDKKPGKPRRPPAKGTLTWIGFEAKDGGAQVFFQSPGAFEVKQHLEGTTLVINLNRLGQNTWRQIDTRFFDNPLSGIVARAVGATRANKTRPARGRGISVRVAFKNPKDAREATVQTKTEADGMFYAYLTFPEGAETNRGTSIKEPERAEPER